MNPRDRADSLPALAAALLTLLIALLVAPGVGSAQEEMTFDVEDTTLQTYVVTLSAEGIGKRERAAVATRVSDFVAGHGGYTMLYEKDVKRLADRRAWRAFNRCDDVECLLEHAREFGLHRLVVLVFAKDGDAVAVDIEMDDVLSGKVLNYTVAVTEDPSDLAFLDGPMDELLNGQNDVGQIVAVQPGPGGGGGGGELSEPEEPSEPFVLRQSWAYYTFGAAAALFATGGVYGYLASSAQTDIQAGGHSRAELDQLIVDGKNSQTTANILFISAAVVGAGGGLLFWLAEEDPEEEENESQWFSSSPPSRIGVNVGLGGVGVTIQY